MNDNAVKWVEALESGEYKQAQRSLTEIDANEEIVGHCCLGVACQVAIANGLEIEHGVQSFGISGTRTYAYGVHKAIGILPEEVKDWLGLRSADGAAYDDGALTVRNDRGDTFEEIAKFILSEPDGLFR